MANTTSVGINGFGRIGRKILRLALSSAKSGDSQVKIAGINDLSQPETIAHLIKYDSVHGTLDEEVRIEAGFLHVGAQKIALSSQKDPTQLPWKQLGVRYVHECTGVFTDRDKALLHMQAGAQRVIISAPSKDADITLCMGVNEKAYDPSKHLVVSNASCTTNCLAPLVKVLDDNFGVIRGTMLTVHSYTNDQQLLDLSHKDLRRSRAAALSQIPTSTGAAKAVGLVLPHLKGKLDGLSIRVPTPNVSIVDFTGEVKKATSKSEINDAFKKASESSMKGILGYCTVPLVSTDYIGDIRSSIIDADLTQVTEGTLVKVLSWYDNESGFSQRMIDTTAFMASKE